MGFFTCTVIAVFVGLKKSIISENINKLICSITYYVRVKR